MAMKFLFDNQEINISELSGKLEGFNSLSTSVISNIYCNVRKALKGSVCEKCYADASVNRYTNLAKNLEHNTKVLTSRLFEISEIPYFPFSVFRFESHGDLNNVTQARNYIRIAKRNPHCIFSIWTKNVGFLDTAISLEGKPGNLICGISSLYLNSADREIAKKYSWCDFLFTVYTSDYAISHGIDMNCQRKCIKCMKCYTLENFLNRDGFLEINEILKSESKKIKVEGDD